MVRNRWVTITGETNKIKLKGKNITINLHDPISYPYWVLSEEASNLGGFISGICTLMLLLLSIIIFLYGPYLFARWKKEKQAEKLSDVAEEALNHLDLFKDRIDIWVKFADTWFIYNRHSNQNVQALNQLSENEKKKLLNQFDNDKYEIHNYCKEANQIMEELRRVKYKILRLSNPNLESKMNEFEKIVKTLRDSLFNKHFPVADVKMKKEGERSFKEASEEIEVFYRNIHDQLLEIFNFQNKIR